MQALVEWLTKNLLALWPVARVYSWEQAIRVRGGRISGSLLSPGLHWRWLFLDQVFRIGTADRVMDLLTATVVTTDGKTVVASANLVFRVTDVRAMWMKVDNINSNVRNLALGLLAQAVVVHSWDDLRARRLEIEQGLATTMTERTAAWGIVVVAIYITDLAPARALRLLHGED